MLQRIRDVKKNQSGFTLIELLIVIVILGILAAVVVLAVGAFNNNGKTAACQSDFKSVEIADEAYYAKNNATYALTMGTTTPPVVATALVPTYLKEPPTTTNGYTIKLTATGVTVTVGATTSADASACSGLGG
jgi:prepilin-type N-terminal cleavage/methylation domain-containing protein